LISMRALGLRLNMSLKAAMNPSLPSGTKGLCCGIPRPHIFFRPFWIVVVHSGRVEGDYRLFVALQPGLLRVQSVRRREAG
jgi:hypothetical protein